MLRVRRECRCLHAADLLGQPRLLIVLWRDSSVADGDADRGQRVCLLSSNRQRAGWSLEVPNRLHLVRHVARALPGRSSSRRAAVARQRIDRVVHVEWLHAATVATIHRDHDPPRGSWRRLLVCKMVHGRQRATVPHVWCVRESCDQAGLMQYRLLFLLGHTLLHRPVHPPADRGVQHGIGA